MSKGVSVSERLDLFDRTSGERADGDAGSVQNPSRHLDRGRAVAADDVVGVAVAQPGTGQLLQRQGDRDRLGHALTMRIAYADARGELCDLADDPSRPSVQSAYMTRDIERNHLRAWRTFRQMTQAQLAELAGTTGAVISNLEVGERGLSDKWLRRLAPHLGTTPGNLLDHDPEAIPTALLDVWAEIPDDRREQALQVLRTFAIQAAA